MSNIITIGHAVDNSEIDVFMKSTYDTDNLFWFYRNLNGILAIDRFGYANKYCSFPFYKSAISELPDTSSSITFEQCVENRAKELIAKANSENKKIAVFCSGGVDSVCVVCAFLLYGLDKEKLVVLYTKSSVEEYPLFFEIMKRENIETIEMTQKLHIFIIQNYAKNHILISGTCGDKLFGSALLNSRFPDWYHKDYKEFCRQHGASDNVISQFEDVFAHYNFPVKETSEMMWWMNFNINFTKACYVDNMNIQIEEPFVIFYNSKDFDNWSYSRFDEKSKGIPTDPENYRPEQKAIIYKYTNDMDYVKTKNKIISFFDFIDVNKKNLFPYVEVGDKISFVKRNKFIEYLQSLEN